MTPFASAYGTIGLDGQYKAVVQRNKGQAQLQSLRSGGTGFAIEQYMYELIGERP